MVVANESDLDLKPSKRTQHQYEGLAWDFKPLNPLHNQEPYIEIQLQSETLLMNPQSGSQASNACNVKGSSRYTDGQFPASLCQVGSYGSCLSALRSKMNFAMEGSFTSKELQGGVKTCKSSLVHISISKYLKG